MTKQLYLLRHAKSDWDVAVSDQDRPLNKRGQRDSLLMGEWMQSEQLIPDCIISSHSSRTRETIMNVCLSLEFDSLDIYWEEELYHANHQVLLAESIKFLDKYNTVMLVSHNPGLDDLVTYLCPENELLYTDDAKLMTTACFAEIEVPESLNEIAYLSGSLLQLKRPVDIRK
ncbi:MAG: histidine phosphatase family protein [Gammaproteobacteria bacterium]|jgi:phosphohistidine phosphatase|nr:histidine phosphatase family protein [Gammaproteobacteria bacterium]